MAKVFIPKTGRQCAKRRFYVFFKQRSKHEGKYAVVEASSEQKAYNMALGKYGWTSVGSITPNEEYALNKIKAYGFKEVEACTK